MNENSVLSYEDWKILMEMSQLRNLNHVLEGLCVNKDFEKEYMGIWITSKGDNDNEAI